jgi:site-specific recombinase XerD
VEPAAALRYIRSQLVMAAHREKQFATARLLRLDLPSASPAAPRDLPSLDDYRTEKDPHNFYNEKELLALYLKDYPYAEEDDARARRARDLHERQLATVDQLERLLARAPRTDDAVAAWFELRLAARLERAGLKRLDALTLAIDTYGNRWHARVRGLGAKGAKQILAWLQHHAAELGWQVPVWALVPRRQLDVVAAGGALGPATAIVPLERFAPPAALDGAGAKNRASAVGNLTGAANDYAAIQSWLASRGSSPHTRRSYRKEAERLLMWAILERGKALSDLDIGDCAAYRDFLHALGRTAEGTWRGKLPQTVWIGPRNAERLSPAWRPFDGPLSQSSQQHARVVLQALFQWLTDMGYLAGNPWKGVARGIAPTEAAGNAASIQVDIRERALNYAQWAAVREAVAQMQPGQGRARLQFVLTFAYGTGLRTAEMVAASTGALRHYETDGAEPAYDMLVVRGKGDKVRMVPMPSALMQALCAYLGARGLADDPYACDPATRLIAPLDIGDAKAGVSESTLYKMLKACFASAAQRMRRAGKREPARRLEAASTHWLRHTCGTHAEASGVPLQVIQENFGHEDLNTTALYATQSSRRRFAAMEQFMATGAAGGVPKSSLAKRSAT